jgi:ribonuclease-3
MRAAVVNARALADVARGLGLGPCLRLGRGERSTGGQDKSSILADALEAVIGAIYLEHGIGVAADVVTRHFQPLIVDAAGLGAGLDWKTSLQELTAERGLGVPDYVVKESGPDHAKQFTARVRIGANLIGHGAGRSKKEAEQEAAESAYRSLAEGAAEADDAGTA